MKLTRIKRLLRLGFSPTDFGAQLIGDGTQRKAFLIGDYVIKRRCPAWQHDRRKNNECAKPCARRLLFMVPKRALRRVGVLPPEQHIAGEWVIQIYYRPLSKTELVEWDFLADAVVRWQNIELDVSGNIGVHLRTGAVHCFDWIWVFVVLSAVIGMRA